MELKEFIGDVLHQIIEGVVTAQERAAKYGAVINPENVRYQEEGQWNTYQGGIPQDVEFDVGLTSTGKHGSSEGVGVFLGSISLGKKNESGSEQTAVTKVKFTVPLVLPLPSQKAK